MRELEEPSSSTLSTRATTPQVIAYQEITSPGAYVEVGSGDLFRVPKEALVHGASPIITKESRGQSRMIRVSANPWCTLLEARLAAARFNVEPNF